MMSASLDLRIGARCQVDLILSGDLDAGVFELRLRERNGRIEAQLCADAVVVRRGIEFRAQAAVNRDEVAVGLKPGGHRPFDLFGIVDVDVLVDHVDVFDVVVGRKCCKDHVLAFTLETLLEGDVEMIAADAALREVDIAHARKVAAQDRKDRRLARDPPRRRCSRLPPTMV